MQYLLQSATSALFTSIIVQCFNFLFVYMQIRFYILIGGEIIKSI